jgi:hypothetical protein
MSTSEDLVNQTLADLAAIKDPVERAKQAATVIELARTRLMAGARQIRQDAVNELRAQGLTLSAVGELIGQSTSRTQQISEGRSGGKPKAKGALETAGEAADAD